MDNIFTGRVFRYFICLLVFLLPVLANLVEHAGSVILLILTVFGIAAGLARSRVLEFSRAEKWIMFSFAAYIGVCLLFFLGHGLIGGSVPLKWKLDHESRMLAFIPLYFLFIRTGLKPGALWWGIATGAIMSGVFAVYYTYLLHGIRATGSYHAIAFGDVSLMLGFMSMTGIPYFINKHRLLAAVPVLAFTGGILGTFLSATRGALLAIPVLVIIVLIQMGRYPRALLVRTVFLTVLCGVVSGSCLLPGSLMDDRIRQGIQEIRAFFGQTDAQHEVRLKMWAESINIIRENPFTGVGHGGYGPVIQQRSEKNQNLMDIRDYGTPHNMFLTNMVDYGIAGLIILLAIFITPVTVLWAARRAAPYRDYGFAGLILVFSYFHFGLTESIFHRNVYVTTYLILLAAILSLCRKPSGDSGATAVLNHKLPLNG